MDLKKNALLIIFSIFSISLFAQENVLKSDFKVELGVNRSEIPFTRLKTEGVNGGFGWNVNMLYNLKKGRFFAETGLGYRNMNFLISEDLSQVRKFEAKASSINIPILIGTNFIKGDHKVLPILKTGINLDYTINLNSERSDILTKSDLQSLNLTYNISAGVKINKVELLLSYNTDLNKYIKTINNNNSYIGLKLAYNFFSN